MKSPVNSGVCGGNGGLIAGLRLPLLFLPLMFVTGIKNKKDIFLLVFSVYALAIGYECEVTNLYEADMVKVVSVVVPSLLLLDSGLKIRLKGEETSFAQVPLIAFIIAFVIGWFVREVFVAAGIVFSLLLAALVLGQGVLNLEGGGATQVVFIAAVSTLIALVFFWRKRERVEFELLPLVPVYR